MTIAEAIAAHNQLCADVRRGREAAKIEWSLRYLIQAAQAVVQNVWPVLTSNGITLSVSAIVDLREAIGRGRAALDGGLTVCPDCGGSGYVSDNHGSGEFCGCNGELVRRAALDAGQGEAPKP